jgi:hypothetical protein
MIEAAVPAAETSSHVPEPNLTHEQSAPDTVETPVPDEPGPVVEEDGPIVEEDDPVVEKDDPIVEKDGSVEDDDRVAEDEPAAPEPSVENSAPLPEDRAPATESAAPIADETLAESTEHDQEGLSTIELAAAAAEDTVPATEEQAGVGENAQAEPVVEQSLPSEEQVVQEPAAHSSSEVTAIATQEEPLSVPGLDTAAASESEAPLAAVDSASSETTGAVDASS